MIDAKLKGVYNTELGKSNMHKLARKLRQMTAHAQEPISYKDEKFRIN